jgi:transcriptional regulator with XRE-family HTH domain
MKVQDSSSNPLAAARIKLGLSRRELAIQIGVPYGSIAALEIGSLVRIPLEWKPGVDSAGLPYDNLAAEYLDWRRAQAKCGREP